MYRTAEGFVLRSMPLGEADVLYAIYTKEYGKIHARAQGVRKEEAKLRGHCEVLNHTRISFVAAKNGERLTHATVIQSWPLIRSEYETLALALRMAALIDKTCFVGMQDDQVWAVLSEYFYALESGIPRAQQGDFFTQFTQALNTSLGL